MDQSRVEELFKRDYNREQLIKEVPKSVKRRRKIEKKEQERKRIIME
jgi:hypothetical protein